MATSYYSTGTISLTNGSAVVTGNGTAWQIALVTNGWIKPIVAGGHDLPIASVDSDTEITAEFAWQGPTGTYPYSIQRDGDQVQDNAENAKNLTYLLQELRKGTLFKYDASGTLADRALFDGRPKGFSYLVLDDEAELWVKASNTSGDWSGPYAYGTGPAGPMGPGGYANPRGTYAAETAYARNDAVLYNGSSYVALQATTGNAPPSLPTTADAYWQLTAVKGADGTGIGDMLASVYDPTDQKRDAFQTIRTDAAQSLSAAQKGQAIANFGGGVLAGFREKIINGDFEIWQRATSQNTSGYRSTDRWNIFGGGTWTFARVLNASNAFLDAPKYNGFLNVTVGADAANPPTIQQRIEGIRQFDGKGITFRARIFPTVNMQVTVAPFMVYGTGGSAVDVIPVKTQNLVANVWNEVKLTFDLPTLAGKTISETDSCLQIQIRFPTGLVFGAYNTRISLVEGDATAEEAPPPPRHIQQELALCQRYYEKGAAQLYISGASSQFGAAASFKVSKRSAPTISLSNPTSGGVAIPDTVYPPNVEYFQFFSSTSNAEYNFAWAASAEL